MVFDCLSIPTFAKAIGSGPPLFVIHGGPGFSHEYLEEPLQKLIRRRTLIFYDQPGCGMSSGRPTEITLDVTSQHFRALTDQLLPSVTRAGILAHSWGGLVFIASDPGSNKSICFSEGLIIAPVPSTRVKWDLAVNALLSRIPASKLAKFYHNLNSGSRQSPFSTIMQYYYKQSHLADQGNIEVISATYLSIIDQLGNFDYQDHAERSLSSIHLLVPTDDFTSVDLLPNEIAACKALLQMDCGHFPFFEKEDDFANVLQGLFL